MYLSPTCMVNLLMGFRKLVSLSSKTLTSISLMSLVSSKKIWKHKIQFQSWDRMRFGRNIQLHFQNWICPTYDVNSFYFIALNDELFSKNIFALKEFDKFHSSVFLHVDFVIIVEKVVVSVLVNYFCSRIRKNIVSNQILWIFSGFYIQALI